MSLPNMPENKNGLNEILKAIASKEKSLANFINAEGEKIQTFASKPSLSLPDIINFQKEIASNIKNTMEIQMVLQFKLEKILVEKNFKANQNKRNKFQTKLINILESIVFLESVLDNFLEVELKEKQRIIQRYEIFDQEIVKIKKITKYTIKNIKKIQRMIDLIIKDLEIYL